MISEILRGECGGHRSGFALRAKPKVDLLDQPDPSRDGVGELRTISALIPEDLEVVL